MISKSINEYELAMHKPCTPRNVFINACHTVVCLVAAWTRCPTPLVFLDAYTCVLTVITFLLARWKSMLTIEAV